MISLLQVTRADTTIRRCLYSSQLILLMRRRSSSNGSSSKAKERVVIIGTGWAGFSLARGLRSHLFDIHIVSPRNHYLFTPLLPSTTVGTLEFRAIQEPIRSIPDIHYHQAEAFDVDFIKKQVACRDSFSGQEFNVLYDKLILAMGAQTNTFGVPGVTTANHVYFLKQLSDARLIRNRLVECFERASAPFCTTEEQLNLLRFVIVGGGPTSIEFAAELYDFVNKDARRSFPDLVPRVSVVLIEASHQILGTFDSALIEYTTNLFKTRNVKILMNTTVVGVKDQRVLLNDGSAIDYGLAVWSTGIKPVDFTNKLDLKKIRGRIVVDEYLRVPNMEGVYALGDCAAGEHEVLPALAQVANQQGKYLTSVLNSGHNRAFVYRPLGSMAQVGDWKAVVDFQGSGRKMSGFLAWAIWRSAYWTRTVSWANKILIPMYWFKTWIFGRDISMF